MKKTSAHITILALAMVSLLSSCAFLQKGEFAQRKYYNFPRTSHSDVQTASAVSAVKETTPVAVVQPEQVVSEPVLSASANHKEIIVKKTVSKAVKHAVVSTTTSAESTSVAFKKSEIRKQAKQEAHNFYQRTDGGTYLFLEVVAAIFFPPLGVYIKDHHTNKWFWITLLLCLIGAGVFFAYTGGLWSIAWLAAVIIALMDVFDLI